jgi:putative hydrolase of the HAD superfamily
MNRRPIRFVLFDAVGTLIYPSPPVAEVYAAAGRRFGSALTATEIRPRFIRALAREGEAREGEAPAEPLLETNENRERRCWQQIVADVFDDVRDYTQLFDKLWNHFADPTAWRVFDDVAPTWKLLERAGYQLGIASNFDARLISLCEAHPPLDRCQHVYVSSLIGFAKPSPRFFEVIESKIAAAPEEILFVGDDVINDAVAGNTAGWWTILLDRSGEQPTSGGHELIRGLGELAPLLGVAP